MYGRTSQHTITNRIGKITDKPRTSTEQVNSVRNSGTGVYLVHELQDIFFPLLLSVVTPQKSRLNK